MPGFDEGIVISLRAGVPASVEVPARQQPDAREAIGPEARRSVAWRAILGWAVPALVAAGLGAWRLTGAALWADELATWGAVRLSWSQLWQLSGSVDAVLAPYYAVMKVYTAVAGTGTAALRVPALLATVLTTLVVTALGRRLGGATTGLFAGLMFAVLPVVSRYAQEARPYAFLMLFGALAVWFLLMLMDRPGAVGAIGYGVATAAASLMHPLSALLMLAGHATAMSWRQLVTRPREWRVAGWWAAAATAGAVPAVLLLRQGMRQRTQISWIKLVDLDVFQLVPHTMFVSAALGGMLLVLAVLGVPGGSAAHLLAAAGFVPPAVLLVVGTQIPAWGGRYVLIAVPALAVLAGAAVAKAGRLPGAAALGLVALLAYPVHLDVRAAAGHGQDSRKVAQVIGPRYAPGDVAVFPDSHPSIPWSPRDIYERYLPAPRPPDVLRVTGQRTNGRLLARECPAAACLGTPNRIWVINVDAPSDPFMRMAPAKRDRIKKHYRVVRTWKYPLLQVTLLQRS